MNVVDASVWTASILVDDLHHAASSHWLEDQVLAGVPMVVPIIFLAEVSGAVARRTGRPDVGYAALQDIRDSPAVRLVPVDDELGQLAAELAVRLRLKGADSIYVATAQHLGIPLVTWDHEQRERSRRAITALCPSTK